MPTLDPNLPGYANLIHTGTLRMFDHIRNGIFLWPANIPEFVGFLNSYNDNSASGWGEDMKSLIVKSAAYAFFRRILVSLKLSTRNEGHQFNTTAGWYPHYMNLFVNLSAVLTNLMQNYS
jgi:hypothetical protein